jgi:predicted nucleic acid-binding protein
LTREWRELVTRYGDLPLGMVDASVVAVAERLKVDNVATLIEDTSELYDPATFLPSR